MNARGPRSLHKDGHKARSASRLAAVQALFQMDQTGETAEEAIATYLEHYMGATIDGETYAGGNPALFKSVVAGVASEQVAIDGAIDRSLPEDWPLHRIDSILRAILRSGTFELLRRPDIPARVIINEYVDVARAFFHGPEAAMANGVLDRLARAMRADEMAAPSQAPKTAEQGDGA